VNEATKLATDILSPLSGRGDWIPDVFKHIFKNGKSTDLVTCCVFSKILYWFTLSRGGRKKYYGKFLRLSSSDIAEQVCITYTQAKRALALLEEKYKFITRDNRGSVTAIHLNLDTIRSAVELYQPSIADAEIVYQPSVTHDGLSVTHDGLSVADDGLSIADENTPSELSIANETSLMGSAEPIHIHKEEHINNFPRKGNSKKLSDSQLERKTLQVAELDARLESLVFTEEYFLEVCRIVKNLVTSRSTNGDTVESLLNFLLSSSLSSDMYPAYARLYYMFTNIPEKFKEYPTEELMYQFRTECIGNSALIALMEKHCPELDIDQFNFDVEKMNNDAIQEYNKLLSERDAISEEILAGKEY
jgi:hypothetical protein